MTDTVFELRRYSLKPGTRETRSLQRRPHWTSLARIFISRATA